MIELNNLNFVNDKHREDYLHQKYIIEQRYLEKETNLRLRGSAYADPNDLLKVAYKTYTNELQKLEDDRKRKLRKNGIAPTQDMPSWMPISWIKSRTTMENMGRWLLIFSVVGFIFGLPGGYCVYNRIWPTNEVFGTDFFGVLIGFITACLETISCFAYWLLGFGCGFIGLVCLYTVNIAKGKKRRVSIVAILTMMGVTLWNIPHLLVPKLDFENFIIFSVYWPCAMLVVLAVCMVPLNIVFAIYYVFKFVFNIIKYLRNKTVKNIKA